MKSIVYLTIIAATVFASVFYALAVAAAWLIFGLITFALIQHCNDTFQQLY